MNSDDLVLIHGEERYRIDRDARAWLARARTDAVTELDVEIIDGASRLDQVRSALIERPFLSSARHLLLRDPPQLSERVRRGAEGADALAAALAGKSPDTRVCIVVHQRVAPQHPVLTTVRSAGRVVEHARLKGRELRAAIEALIAERGARLPRGGVDHLLQVSGGDLGIVESELAKLAAYAEGRALGIDQLRELVAGSEHVQSWDVVDRLLTAPHGRGPAAVESLLADGMSPQLLLSQVAAQLREMLQAQEILAEPRADASRLASVLGLAPWQGERLVRRSRAATPAQVEGWLRALQWLDAESKAGRLEDAAGLRSVMLRAARQLEKPSRPLAHRA
jgi:DNA polymerase III delta subunit